MFFRKLGVIMKFNISTVAIFFLTIFNYVIGYADEISENTHRTKAATEKLPALVCYRCDTMIDGKKCENVKESNSTQFYANCSDESRICQVKRISMTTINRTGEAGKPKLWLLQRNCTGTCDPGCIIIGERTKIYSCTTCCEESHCNYGNNAKIFKLQIQILDLIYFYVICLFVKSQT